MQIESLKVFCDLIDTRSFSKAAARNAISQSAVSQQIRTLEDRFGRKLIERSRRGLGPTAAGVVFYQGCREVLEHYAALIDEMSGVGNTVRGTVRIATIYSVGLYELPALVRRFIKAYPAVNIQIEYSRTNKIYEDLIGGSIDLGLVAYPVPRPQLEVIPFRDDQLVLICSPDHELSKAGRVAIAQLSGQRFVGFERGIPTRKAIDDMLRDNGAIVQYAMELDNIETIKRAVEVDQGVAIVPDVTVQNEVRAGTLRSVEFTRKLSRSVGIVHRKGKVFSTAVDNFVALLTSRKRS
jgi:DNA-binding transcriptional LysR family regulator